MERRKKEEKGKEKMKGKEREKTKENKDHSLQGSNYTAHMITARWSSHLRNQDRLLVCNKGALSPSWPLEGVSLKKTQK